MFNLRSADKGRTSEQTLQIVFEIWSFGVHCNSVCSSRLIVDLIQKASNFTLSYELNPQRKNSESCEQSEIKLCKDNSFAEDSSVFRDVQKAKS